LAISLHWKNRGRRSGKEYGVRNLELGTRNLELGTWNLELKKTFNVIWTKEKFIYLCPLKSNNDEKNVSTLE
jgi:hypothetical protein